MDEPESERLPSPARLSKTPSWITLGFVLGALFVFALPREEHKPEPVRPPPPVKLERPTLTEIEAVFADWGEGAVWENDLTEVALWDRDRKSYSLFYEVLRSGDNYYFRSIPNLNRPLLTEGVRPNSPLLFTEPESNRNERQRRRWESIMGTPPPTGKP